MAFLMEQGIVLQVHDIIVKSKFFCFVQLWLLATLFLSGCSLLGYERWGAYKVEIQVQDAQGEALADITLTSTDQQQVRTNRHGKAKLRYLTRGLHVVTAVGQGWQTEQTKVMVPEESDQAISIIMSPVEPVEASRQTQ